jgi:hypothetical protein
LIEERTGIERQDSSRSCVARIRRSFRICTFLCRRAARRC